MAQEAAKAAVLKQAAQTAGVVATVPANNNTPVALRPAAPLSMDDMKGGGIAVDGWIGVNEHGMIAGPKKVLASSQIVVDIDLTAIGFNFAIKFGKNPVTYFKTYDRVTEARGGSWAEAVDKAHKVDPSAREYRSADVPMTVVGDIMKGKEVLVTDGTLVGYSIATTGWNNFSKFWKECEANGLTNGTVRVALEAEPKASNGNTWGVIKWNRVAA